MAHLKISLVTILVLSKFLNCHCKEILPLDCGRARASKRIIQGYNAYMGQFPSIARIGYEDNKFLCGGVIITKRHVLTTATCLDGNPAKLVRVGDNFGGSPDCEKGLCAPYAQDISISSNIKHPRFNRNTNVNDIGLITLSKNINFNGFVQPACMPQKSKFKQFEKKLTGIVQVAGWGYTDWQLKYYPNALKYAPLDLVDHSICQKQFRIDPYYEPTQYCADDLDGNGRDSCNGDTGGPIYKYYTSYGNRKQFAIGLVSYGLIKCGQGPAVYTNIAYYMNWIEQNL